MVIKKCAGAVIYDKNNKIFLMSSPKWKGYIVPGGRIEEGESGEEALRREIREELGIEIENIVKVSESIKKPSADFIDPTMTFHFLSYFAKALKTAIKPNHEISKYGWYTTREALELPLIDSTRDLVGQFISYLNKR